MTVHSFHIFDRKGKTLFTKRYAKAPGGKKSEEDLLAEKEQLSEQRKLVFGMLFSLRELSSSLSPAEGPGDLHMVKTGASTLYNYETVSGLRFVLYTTPDTKIAAKGGSGGAAGTPQSSVHGGSSGPILTAPTATGFANSATSSDPGGGGSGAGGGGPSSTNPAVTADVRSSLKHIYETIWVTSVIRSPMYRPNSSESIRSTSFEADLDAYFKRMAWFP